MFKSSLALFTFDNTNQRKRKFFSNFRGEMAKKSSSPQGEIHENFLP